MLTTIRQEHELRKTITMVFATIFISIVLTLIHWGESNILSKPMWVILIVIYWLIYLPRSIGLVHVWLLGLLLDIILFTPAGQHAVVYSFIAFIVMKLQSKLIIQSILQQIFMLFIVFLLAGTLDWWISKITHQYVEFQQIIYKAISSCIFYPLIYFFIKYLNSIFHIKTVR